MANVGTLTIEMAADIARLKKDVAAGTKVVKQGADRMAKAARTAKGIFATIGIGIGVAAIGALTKGTIDALDRMQKLSVITKLTVEEIAGLGHAAQLSGTNLETVAKAVNKLGTELGKDPEKFARIGVTSDDRLTALGQLADALQLIKNKNDQAAVAQKALGGDFERLAPLLEAGSAGIREMVTEGQNLSGITTQMAEDAALFNDQLQRGQLQLSGWAAGVIGNVIPVFNQLSKEFTATSTAVGSMGNANSLAAITIKGISIAANDLVTGLKKAGLSLGAFGAQSAAFFSGNFKDISVIGRLLDEDKAKLDQAAADFNKRIALAGLTPEAKAAGINAAVQQGTEEGQAAAKAFLETKASKENAAAAKATASKQQGITDALQAQLDALRLTGVEMDVLKAKQAGMVGGALENVRVLSQTIEDTKKYNEFITDQQEAFAAANESYLAFIASQKENDDLLDTNIERAELELNLIKETAEVREKALRAFDREIALRLRLKEIDSLSVDEDTRDRLKGDERKSDIRARELADIQEMTEKERENFQELSEFGIQAARSTQQAFADFLFNPLDKGFKGMVMQFGNAIRKMVANALAAKLGELLLGGIMGGAGGGGGGGLFGGIMGGLFSGIGSLFGGIGGGMTSGFGATSIPLGFASGINTNFANGGLHGGGLRMVGERGPEIEATGPARIFNNNETRQMMGGGRSVKINDNRRIVVEATADRQETIRIIDRMVQQGNSEMVERLHREGEL